MKNRRLFHIVIAVAVMAAGILGWAALGGIDDGSWWGLIGGGILGATLITAWIALQMAQRIIRLQKDLAYEIDRRTTSDRALAESSQRYADFFNQSQVGMLIIDSDTHRVRDINQSALALLGTEKDLVVDRSCHQFLCPGQECQCPVTDQKETIDNAECLLVRADGATVPILKRVISISRQGKAQLLESFIDISQLKRTQTNLEIALSAAREANLTKGEFLANMSHEIRTPMNGIIGLTNIMLRTQLDRDQLEYMQIIQNSADSLLRIVNDILDFSKIESGTLEMEKLDFDLQATVESAVDALACTAHEKGLEFSFLIDPVVPIHLIGDPGRLRQVLLNLLNNAVKFTARGEVFLYVTLEKKELSAVCLKFSIKDTGIGIPSDRIGLIFNSFSQVDASTTRKYGGTGLGLAISKNLVEMMNGAIEVQSTSGQGSVFVFTAQFQRQWQTRKHPQAPEHPLIGTELQDKRILCVDDNRTNLTVLQGYLQFWDLRFSLAESGDQALEMMRRAVGHKDPYHLVIMDHMMPGMDGTALGSAIREEALIGDVKMVLLTSMGSEIKTQELERIGFDGCLTKPIHMRHFHNCLLLVFQKGAAISNTGGSSPDKAQMITPQVVDCTISNGYRILVVEDNFINQKIMEKILGMHGYQTEIAGNGREAVRMLSTKIFDLVLMDIQMPLMNGLEATAAIRDPAGPCKNNLVPIVALTANAMPRDRQICLDAGMDDYIAKPVNPKTLTATIKRWLDRPAEPDAASMAG